MAFHKKVRLLRCLYVFSLAASLWSPFGVWTSIALAEEDICSEQSQCERFEIGGECGEIKFRLEVNPSASDPNILKADSSSRPTTILVPDVFGRN